MELVLINGFIYIGFAIDTVGLQAWLDICNFELFYIETAWLSFIVFCVLAIAFYRLILSAFGE